MLLCAGLISVAFGSLLYPTARKGFTRAMIYFALFITVSIALAWLMYPFSH